MTGGPSPEDLLERVRTLWDSDVLPTLESYTRIPNVSRHFAPSWESDGYMDEAVELLSSWCRSRNLEGAAVEVVRIAGLSPTIVVDVPAYGGDTEGLSGDSPGVVLYGHMDKQPEFPGWHEGFSAWEPVRRGDRLYGRGTADDGYAVFAALTSIEALRSAGGSHPRCLVIIEGSEESGSPDLPETLDSIKEKIGNPALVVALDTGCPTYDRMWATASLRGLVGGTLKVEVLDQGVHSGAAGGVVPSSFRIARMLLSRVEDEETGEILLEELNATIPDDVVESARQMAETVGESGVGAFPTVPGLELGGKDTTERILRRTWKPAMSVIGAEGLPDVVSAGNVLRPFTTLQLGFRLPPTCDAESAAAVIGRVLTENPPYNARVTFEAVDWADGWVAPPRHEWLSAAIDEASTGCFGLPSGSVGEGGSIPFMAMLADRVPQAQILATGVLGPGSNAHGPNEFLDIPTAIKLTASLAMILDAAAREIT